MNLKKIKYSKPGVVVDNQNPSTQEDEAGEPKAFSWFGPYSEFKPALRLLMTSPHCHLGGFKISQAAYLRQVLPKTGLQQCFQRALTERGSLTLNPGVIPWVGLHTKENGMPACPVLVLMR